VASGGVSVVAAAGAAADAGDAAGGCWVAAGAVAPPETAFTALWQAGERLARFCCKHSSAALPPGETDEH
jgi:hypothetical protein